MEDGSFQEAYWMEISSFEMIWKSNVGTLVETKNVILYSNFGLYNFQQIALKLVFVWQKA